MKQLCILKKLPGRGYMSDSNKKKELKTIANCSDDLQTIKALLLEVKTKTIYERWAFFVWGVLIILGGITHFIFEGLYTLKTMDDFMFIWIPVMILAGLFELISFIQNLSKKSLSVFSRPIIKFFLGLIILSFMVIFTSIVLLQLNYYNYIPLFLTFAGSGFFILYAMATHINYFFPAAFLTALAVILFFFTIPTRVLVLICSLGVGIAWIAGGITCYFLEKKD